MKITGCRFILKRAHWLILIIIFGGIGNINYGNYYKEEENATFNNHQNVFQYYDDLSVLEPELTESNGQGQILTNYFSKLVKNELINRKNRFEQVIESGEIREYQEIIKNHLFTALGGFPEETPLNAKIIGAKEYDDYCLEKVLYESRPNFYVSGLLYLPKKSKYTPPYPGVLVLCGHT